MNVTLDERVTYLLVGLAIGFILGYFTAYLKKIKNSVVHIEEIVVKDHKEEGYVKLPNFATLGAWRGRFPRWRNAALFLVVIMTAWSSFSTQVTNNRLEENGEHDRQTQESISKVTFCNQQAISKVIVALDERVTSSRAQTDANVKLQKGFLEFLRILQFQPPKPEAERREAFNGYVTRLDNFVEKAEASKQKQNDYPFPTPEELSACLHKPLDQIKKDPDYER